jgi:transposase-like protein
MECQLCGHQNTHKHGKTSKGSQRYRCPNCQQTFTETFGTLYYRRQVTAEQIRLVLQSHSEGASQRGVSRIAGLAYNTGVNIIRAASSKAQQVHNAEVRNIEAGTVSADELWSFVKRTKTLSARRKGSRRLLGCPEYRESRWINSIGARWQTYGRVG